MLVGEPQMRAPKEKQEQELCFCRIPQSIPINRHALQAGAPFGEHPEVSASLDARTARKQCFFLRQKNTKMMCPTAKGTTLFHMV